MPTNDLWIPESKRWGGIILDGGVNSAHRVPNPLHLAMLLISLALPAFGIWLGWLNYSILIVGVITTVAFGVAVLRMIFAPMSVTKGRVVFTDADQEALHGDTLPMWTILAPLYHEVAAVPSLVANLQRIIWPTKRLQILFLVREEDEETLSALYECGLPNHMNIVLLPEHHFPKSKPSALNYGLDEAKGEYITIVDAETIMDPRQLSMAYVAHVKHKNTNVIGVQAETAIYNTDESYWSRMFSAEYAAHYRLFNPAIFSIGGLAALPGNSVHYITGAIKELAGWDPWNPTEDADLSVRIARQGWRNIAINSESEEEAPTTFLSWLPQRARWIKGFMMTWLVHMHNPIRLLRELGVINFILFQSVFGFGPMILILNPVFLLLTGIYAYSQSTLIQSLYPTPIFWMGMITMIVGNTVFGAYYVFGCMMRKQYSAVPWALAAPLYWMCLSIAAWRALYELIFAPHKWNHTQHGAGKIGFGQEVAEAEEAELQQV